MAAKKVKPVYVIIGAILAIVIAAALIFKQASTPGETITRFEDVPPKGAGKYDRK